MDNMNSNMGGFNTQPNSFNYQNTQNTNKHNQTNNTHVAVTRR